MAVRQGPSANSDPQARWDSAMERLYPTSPVARKKGSPRGAFLGLCEEGLVKGIPAGHYGAANRHKMYAVRAARFLIGSAERVSRSALWSAATESTDEKENGQMDVVLALWNNSLIEPKP